MVAAARPGLFAQGGVDLFHFAGADDHLEQTTGEERAFDQIDLVQRAVIDQAWVLERQAQAGHAVGSLLKVLAPPEVVENLAGDR